MREIAIDILQGTACGSLLFVFLLCCKNPIRKRCGEKFWHRALLANSVMFVFPVYPLKLALSPLAAPFRARAQDLVDTSGIFRHSLLVSAPDQNITALFRTSLIVWLVGAAAFVLLKAVFYAMFAANASKKSHAAPKTVADIFEGRILGDGSLNKAGRLGRVELFVNSETASPFAYGFFRKRIVLPEKTLGKYDEDDIFLMLRHETMHIVGKDSWKRLFAAFAHAVNWYNPALFLFSRCLKESAELCCDERAVSRQSDGGMQERYAELLLCMASDSRELALARQGMAGSGLIWRRVRSITETPRKQQKPAMLLFSSLLFTLAFICLMGFTVSDWRMEGPYQADIVDIGEESPGLGLPPSDAGAPAHDLSGGEGYVFEASLFADEEAIIPASFLTSSSRISLTLLSDTGPVQAYIYYSGDLGYPLMQLVLEGKGERGSFEALSYKYEYSIGFISDSGSGAELHVLIHE